MLKQHNEIMIICLARRARRGQPPFLLSRFSRDARNRCLSRFSLTAKWLGTCEGRTKEFQAYVDGQHIYEVFAR